MAGIILTLLAAVAAVGFALCPGDAVAQVREEWRDSVPQETMRIRLPQAKLQGETEASSRN